MKFVLVIIEYGNLIGLKDSTLKLSAKLFYKMDSVIDVWKEDILQGRVPKPISDVKKHNVVNHIIPLCIFTTKKRGRSFTRKTKHENSSTKRQNTPSNSVAATHTGGNKVCEGAVPVKVRRINGSQVIYTYALLDNGSEVILCYEKLAKKINIDGEASNFTLTGINGSIEVDSQLVDIVLTSFDGSTEVKLQGMKTVKEIPISSGYIPKHVDVERWPHLRDLCIPELENGNIMLLIGLKENPRLLLPLECKEGGEGDPR